jgi:hypothetical protein
MISKSQNIGILMPKRDKDIMIFSLEKILEMLKIEIKIYDNL